MKLRLRLWVTAVTAAVGLGLGLAPAAVSAAPAALPSGASSTNTGVGITAAGAQIKPFAVKKLKSATPKITGTAQVGKTLKVAKGKWTAGTKFTYQWHANGKKIAKATKTSLKLTSKYAGKKITVKVTGKKKGYKTVTKTSKATAKIAKTAAKKVSPKKVKTYKNCTELHKDYPHGVGKKGAVDKTNGKRVTNFYVNNALYAANAKSDRDKDGIACEKA